MRKTPLILAGAIAFDLGLMVVSGQAAEVPKGPDAPATTVRKAGGGSQEYLKIKLTDVLISSYRINSAHTAQGCILKLGKVVDVADGQECQIPAKTAPAK